MHQLQRTTGKRYYVECDYVPFDVESICNRNKELWGDDAHVFNPERWLNGPANEKKTTSLGVYSNL